MSQKELDYLSHLKMLNIEIIAFLMELLNAVTFPLSKCGLLEWLLLFYHIKFMGSLVMNKHMLIHKDNINTV